MVMTAAGATLGISTTLPATYDATGYNALTYVMVGEITDLGEFGTEYTMVPHTALGQRRTKKYKGSYNNGSLPLQMAKDASDAGQDALQLALASDNSYAFKVTLQDGTKEYFTAKVMSYKNSVGSVDNIVGASTSLEIDSDIVEV